MRSLTRRGPGLSAPPPSSGREGFRGDLGGPAAGCDRCARPGTPPAPGGPGPGRSPSSRRRRRRSGARCRRARRRRPRRPGEPRDRPPPPPARRARPPRRAGGARPPWPGGRPGRRRPRGGRRGRGGPCGPGAAGRGPGSARRPGPGAAAGPGRRPGRRPGPASSSSARGRFDLVDRGGERRLARRADVGSASGAQAPRLGAGRRGGAPGPRPLGRPAPPAGAVASSVSATSSELLDGSGSSSSVSAADASPLSSSDIGTRHRASVRRPSSGAGGLRLVVLASGALVGLGDRAEHTHLLEGGDGGLDLDQRRDGVGVLRLVAGAPRRRPLGRHPLGGGRGVEDRQPGRPGRGDLGVDGVEVLGGHLVVGAEPPPGSLGGGLGRRQGHPELLGGLLDGLADDLVGLQQALPADPELLDLAAEDLPTAHEVLQDPAPDGLGLGDHLPAPTAGLVQLGGHVGSGLGQRGLQGGDGGPELRLPFLGPAEAARRPP